VRSGLPPAGAGAEGDDPRGGVRFDAALLAGVHHTVVGERVAEIGNQPCADGDTQPVGSDPREHGGRRVEARERRHRARRAERDQRGGAAHQQRVSLEPSPQPRLPPLGHVSAITRSVPAARWSRGLAAGVGGQIGLRRC
jgi:hypothetical protein